MSDRYIADEVITGVSPENVLSLVSACIEGMGYIASRIFPDDHDGISQIALFSKGTLEEFDKGTLTPQLGTVLVTHRDFDRGVRIQVWCNADWSALGFDPGFSPCEVGAAITLYLLRKGEGDERANVWHARWVMTAELGDLLEPLILNWRVSDLKKWVNDYALDHNLSVGLRRSPAKGTIHITNTWAGGVQDATLFFDGEQLDDKQIKLTPGLNDAALSLPAAHEDLRRWRSALEAAARPISQDGVTDWEPVDFLIGPIFPWDDYIQNMADDHHVTREVVEQYFRNQGVEVPSKQPTRKRGPNIETLGKLDLLRDARAKQTKDGKVDISFTNACQFAGIDPKTVKANDPDLVENWSNFNY